MIPAKEFAFFTFVAIMFFKRQRAAKNDAEILSCFNNFKPCFVHIIVAFEWHFLNFDAMRMTTHLSG